jgi:hypothetical protein
MTLPALTVVCFLWNGWRPNCYKPEHVLRLKAMAAQHLKQPHDFVCVTDMEVPGVRCVPLPVIPWIQHRTGIPCGYYKLWAFSREAMALGRRLLVMDLDKIIVRNIDGLLTDDPYKVLRGFSCPYGSAIYQVTPGEFAHVWDNLTEEVARKANRQIAPNGVAYNGSDQAVAAYLLPNRPTWSKADGLYHYNYLPEGAPVPDDCRILIYAGRNKPWTGRFARLYWGTHDDA